MFRSVMFGLVLIPALCGFCLWSQDVAPPPPPGPRHGPPPPHPQNAQELARHIDELSDRLRRTPATTQEGRELENSAKEYLEKARAALTAHDLFSGARFAEASDACRRPLDHLERIQDELPAPPGPGPQGRDDLRRVYFRLRLAGFFLVQLPDPKPVRLLEIAKLFYNRALQAQGNHQASMAREYLASSNDLTHALESLAQAYSGQPAPRPK